MLFISGNTFINIIEITYPDGEIKRIDWIPGWIPESGQLFSDCKGLWVVGEVKTYGWDYFEITVVPYEE